MNNNKYWNGKEWYSNEIWFSTNGTTKWSYNTSNILWLTNNQYIIHSRAIDKAGNIENRNLGNTFLYDNQPPKNIFILINNGKRFSNSTSVILSLFCEDFGSGIDEMSFSNNNLSWTDWEPFNKTRKYSLSLGDGIKIIYFKVKDKANNIEYNFNSIILDTTPPHSLSISINNGTLVTNSNLVTLNLSALDDISGIYMMRFGLDGIYWFAWENYSTTKIFLLPEGDGEKTIYFSVMDNCYNIAESIFSSIILNTTSQFIDTDKDGVPNNFDAFPYDPAASVDFDNDNSPDYWNFGKSEKDSTTGLHLDAFPYDPAASVDSDGDNYPDNWNPNNSEKNSTLGLELDAYPNDPNRHIKNNDNKKFDERIFFGIISIICAIIILIIISMMVFRNKNSHLETPFKENEILRKLRYDFLFNKSPDKFQLKNENCLRNLEEKYNKNEMSDETFNYINSLLKNENN